MGIRLMVEVLDHWQDAGLTVGERSDLLVLAENANDGTRLTFGPVHEEYILRRAGKTAEGWKNAIGKLLRKKVLTIETPGRIKQAAVYRLEPLCPAPRHDGYKGACERPSRVGSGGERVTAQVTLSEEEGHSSGDPMGNPTGDPLAREGHLAGGKRVTSQMTPTPPNTSSFKTPSTTPSSSPAEPSETEPPAEPGVTDGGGGGSDLRSLAVHIADSLDYRGKPPTKTQRQTIVDRLVVWLEAGWSMNGLAVILDLTGQAVRHAPTLYALRLDPAEMPAPDPAPASAAAGGGISESWAEASAKAASRLTVGARTGGTDDRVAGRAAVGRQLAAREPHRPYSDDPWHAPADPVEAAKIPWCGHRDCDPDTRLRPGATPQDKPDPCQVCHPITRF